MRAALILAIVCGVPMVYAQPSFGVQQETQCLHGRNETAENKQRREQAIKVAHLINAQQAAAIRTSPDAVYRRGSQLTIPEMPDNFSLTLHLNGRITYSFSLKDFADPCYFAVFSDQDGFVYATQPEPDSRPQR
jgi:hypothetical protein